MFLLKALQFLFSTVSVLVILIMLATLLFIAYRGTQPMNLAQVPARMSYWQFMEDRIQAAKAVKPARFGYLMFGGLAMVGPAYSVLYTYVGIYPDSFLARVTLPDSSIPKGVKGAAWYQVPKIWWMVVEKLSWTALVRQGPGCNFRPIKP